MDKTKLNLERLRAYDVEWSKIYIFAKRYKRSL